MRSKPRSDSALKTLPAIRQEAIADYARDHSLQDTVAWLRADGCKTSKSALSDFLSWHGLQAQLRKNELTVETLLADLARENPDWDPEKIQTVGQNFFTALALQQQDPQVWVATQRLNLDQVSAKTRFEIEKQKLGQSERKIALLEKKAAQLDQVKGVVNSQLSPEEQKQRLKEILK